MPLRADDIEVGQFITILKGPVSKGWNWGREHHEEYDGRNGCVLVVIAISLPYLACGVLADPMGEIPPKDTRVSVDTRRVLLSQLTEDYVYALTHVPVTISMQQFSPPDPTKVVGIAEEVITCKKCGGPWPEHAKTCSDYKARR